MKSLWLAAALAAASVGCASEQAPNQQGAAGSGQGMAGSAAGVSGTAGPDGGAGTAGTAGKDGGGADVAPNLMPTLLSQTGLYTDVQAGTLAPGVYPYKPTYALWSDSAAKKRWAYMPAGGKIDTGDPDFWQYPPGFKLFKEFTRNDAQGKPVRVETRMILKLGQGKSDWYMMGYKWRADGSDADAVPMGEQNTGGTAHDIPTKEQCGSCHNSMQDNALGFTSLQLNHDLDAMDPAGSINLAKVIQMGWLSEAPDPAKVKLPGTAAEQNVLGYLHANCGICHNSAGHVYQTSTTLDLWTHTMGGVRTSVQTLQAYLSMLCDEWPGDGNTHNKYDPISSCTANRLTGAPTETTAAGVVAKRITPGLPMMSAIHQLMSQRGAMFSMTQMPPVGTEDVDTAGLAALDAWIGALPTH
jgi:hypothetical protein